MACGILVRQPGTEPVPLHWERRVLTTEPPGKSTKDFSSVLWDFGKLHDFFGSGFQTIKRDKNSLVFKVRDTTDL